MEAGADNRGAEGLRHKSGSDDKAGDGQIRERGALAAEQEAKCGGCRAGTRERMLKALSGSHQRPDQGGGNGGSGAPAKLARPKGLQPHEHPQMSH